MKKTLYRAQPTTGSQAWDMPADEDEFDAGLYLYLYDDLPLGGIKTASQAMQHYKLHGKSEGRIANRAMFYDRFPGFDWETYAERFYLVDEREAMKFKLDNPSRAIPQPKSTEVFPKVVEGDVTIVGNLEVLSLSTLDITSGQIDISESLSVSSLQADIIETSSLNASKNASLANLLVDKDMITKGKVRLLKYATGKAAPLWIDHDGVLSVGEHEDVGQVVRDLSSAINRLQSEVSVLKAKLDRLATREGPRSKALN